MMNPDNEVVSILSNSAKTAIDDEENTGKVNTNHELHTIKNSDDFAIKRFLIDLLSKNK